MIDYPLRLRPRYDEKIWGGRRLERVLGKPLPAGNVLIGESLESGDDSTVDNGPLAGLTLRELVAREPAALLGDRGLAASRPFGDFPLLVKFIDASDTLSIQVHPNDEQARQHGKRGKTEAWYIVAADPGAELITGLARELSPGEIRDAIASGEFASLVERRRVAAGDTVLVPAGTLHAIGGGVLLYEVQENSDVTYRLYDWDRLDDAGRPRELHLEQALAVLRPELRAPSLRSLRVDDAREILAACRYFALERLTVSGVLTLPSRQGRAFRLLSVIAGAVELRVAGQEPAPLPAGRTALLPAGLPACRVAGKATLLATTVPDLREDVVIPLRAAGHAADAIAALDGGTGDLAGLTL